MTTQRILAGLVLFVASVAALLGGWAGMAYLVAFVAATVPGWPVGRALFGPRHPAAWISGGLLGYGLTSAALWVPIAFQAAWWFTFLAAWAAMVLTTHWVGRRAWARGPMVPLPEWGRDATLALTFVLALVPALIALPDGHIGQRDAQGGRRYRAYFTADFVWHEALTAELARFSVPPRNPYMASQPLHYYWGYFLLPAAATGTTGGRGVSPPIESYLKVNALCAGLLFAGAIFCAAWAAVPRARAVGAAVALALLAASAEGLYSVLDLMRRGIPMSALRGLNIDAITSWFFAGLTIDGLPRSLWYGPQHATSSALGLVALIIAARLGRNMSAAAAGSAGLALGLGFMMSPFPAGVMTLTYAVAVLWDTAMAPRDLPRVVLVQLTAVSFVGAALAWCVWNGTFEGAGGAVVFGLSRAATRRPFTILGLALGPVIVPATAGLVFAAFRWFPREYRPAAAGVGLAGLLFFCVTLVLEPVWVGWRAGQHFLVTAPGLIAAGLAGISDKLGRAWATALVALILTIGLPTTLIDFYNAQDTSNLDMGPGFRWTVLLSPGEQEALDWIDRRTPPSAIVQMSLGPRGRETWSLIPSFGRRRMAAGLPISLLRTPDYDALADRADRLYATPDAAEASGIAHALGIEYIYVGAVERTAFGAAATKFSDRQDLFGTVFANDDSVVYAVY